MDFSATPERIILIVILSLSAGWALGQYWRARDLRRNKHRVRREAKIILQDAQRERTSLLLDAELHNKQRMVDELSRIEAAAAEREQELDARERELTSETARTRELLARLADVNSELAERQRDLAHREQAIKQKEADLVSGLEELAGKSREQAHQSLIEHANRVGRAEAERVFLSEQRLHRGELEQRFGELLIECAERSGRAAVSERTITMVKVPNEEFKARIVGRDGRNVRAFEALSGVDVLLDELEGAIVLSSFDVRRRRVAELALERLIADGRIQPSRIKEFLALAENDIGSKMRERVASAAECLGVGPLAPELEGALVELGFRARDGQNALEHLIECAELAKAVAAELKLPTSQGVSLVRAALFHDVGKSQPIDGRSHALIGAEMLRRCGESEEVVNAVAAHHREVQDSSVICPMLRAIDGLSGGRPGARRDSQENLISRVEEMERIAKQNKGVCSAYAFQGGRELQVIVLSEVVAEYELALLAERIFEQTGGRAKVSVVRETVSTVAPK